MHAYCTLYMYMCVYSVTTHTSARLAAQEAARPVCVPMTHTQACNPTRREGCGLF